MTTYAIKLPERTPASRGPTKGGDVIRLYLEDLERRLAMDQVTEAHFRNHERSLKPAPVRDGVSRFVGFEEIIGDKPLALLVQHDLTKWIAANPQWVSPETRRRNLGAALACFHWAVEEGFILRTPYMKTRRLKEPRVQRRDASDDEARQIWAAANDELRRIIWFIDATGCRTCEARLLRWSDVQWDNRVAVLAEHKTRRAQQQPKPRIIGLESVFDDLVAWYAARVSPDPHVFLTRRGTPWTRTKLAQHFRKLCRKIGLPEDLSAYCFRHRFATQGIVAGLSQREVGDLLGHEDSQTTTRYIHSKTVAIIGMKSAKMASARPIVRPLKLITDGTKGGDA